MPRYWIGGSPCAGKTSIARLLAERHGLVHVECDAGTQPRLAAMAGRGLAGYDELTALGTCDRLAMPPAWQAEREVAFYHEQFPYLLAAALGGTVLVVDGSRPVMNSADLVTQHLGLR